MIKKLGKYLLSAVLAINLVGSTTVFASESQEVIDEKWGNPTFVYGAALNESQVKQTKEILKIESNENVTELKITGKDMVRLLGSGNPNANMYSSALIKGNDLKGGVVVEIITPENITKVSMNQYANALITAGATDVKVEVASPVKVTGESALTGVYLAYEDKGIELDEEAMNVAQEELKVVTDIAQDLAGKEGYDDELLNMALIHIKQELVKAKEKHGENLTEEIIEAIVMEALKLYGLDALVSEAQVAQLVALTMEYKNLENFFTPEMKEQLEQLATDVADKAKDLASDISDKITGALKDEGFWAGVKNFFASIWGFFTGIWDFFADFFKSDNVDVDVQEPTTTDDAIKEDVIDENQGTNEGNTDGKQDVVNEGTDEIIKDEEDLIEDKNEVVNDKEDVTEEKCSEIPQNKCIDENLIIEFEDKPQPDATEETVIE